MTRRLEFPLLKGRAAASLGGLQPIIAICVALLVSGVFIVALGQNPLSAYKALAGGAFIGKSSLANSAVDMIPLLFTGLSVAVSFRAGIWNIGAEGQLYFGAASATFVALLPWGAPRAIEVTACLLAGVLGGILWTVIPAVLYAYRGINEIVTTLMANFIAIAFVDYLVDSSYGPLGDHSAAYSESRQIPQRAQLPVLEGGTSLHAGLIIAILLALALFLVISFTTFGFELRLIGSNPVAGLFAGVSGPSKKVAIMLLSGGIAGLSGAVTITGLLHALYADFSPGWGYSGIAVALLAGNNPVFCVVSAAFFGSLAAGANNMQQVTGIQTSVVDVVEGLTIMLLISRPLQAALRRWRARLEGGDNQPPQRPGSDLQREPAAERVS